MPWQSRLLLTYTDMTAAEGKFSACCSIACCLLLAWLILCSVSAGADTHTSQHCECQEEHRADIWKGHIPVQPPVISDSTVGLAFQFLSAQHELPIHEARRCSPLLRGNMCLLHLLDRNWKWMCQSLASCSYILLYTYVRVACVYDTDNASSSSWYSFCLLADLSLHFL